MIGVHSHSPIPHGGDRHWPSGILTKPNGSF
jgi:predicted N-formylglutamate amidohydrolase